MGGPGLPLHDGLGSLVRRPAAANQGKSQDPGASVSSSHYCKQAGRPGSAPQTMQHDFPRRETTEVSAESSGELHREEPPLSMQQGPEQKLLLGPRLLSSIKPFPQGRLQALSLSRDPSPSLVSFLQQLTQLFLPGARSLDNRLRPAHHCVVGWVLQPPVIPHCHHAVHGQEK